MGRWCELVREYELRKSNELRRGVRIGTVVRIGADLRTEEVERSKAKCELAKECGLEGGGDGNWRKHAANTYMMTNHGPFSDRLRVIRYEDVVADPESELR